MIYTAGGGLVRVLVGFRVVEVMGCAFRLVSGFGWSLVMMLVGLLAEIKVWFRLCIFGLFSFDSSKRNKNIFFIDVLYFRISKDFLEDCAVINIERLFSM